MICLIKLKFYGAENEFQRAENGFLNQRAKNKFKCIQIQFQIYEFDFQGVEIEFQGVTIKFDGCTY